MFTIDVNCISNVCFSIQMFRKSLPFTPIHWWPGEASRNSHLSSLSLWAFSCSLHTHNDFWWLQPYMGASVLKSHLVQSSNFVFPLYEVARWNPRCSSARTGKFSWWDSSCPVRQIMSLYSAFLISESQRWSLFSGQLSTSTLVNFRAVCLHESVRGNVFT